DEMVKLGLTTVECKSGYGLSVEDELKAIRVYPRLAEEQPVDIVSTFLVARTLPPGFNDSRQGYIKLITEEIIPAVAEEGLAEFCDVFAEESAFSIDESREILVAGLAAGLSPQLHAEQLTSCGGAVLAAAGGSARVVHLEYISDDG